MTEFSSFIMTGADAEKFLQGQVTADMAKLDDVFLPSAICNLKGRVQFGLWLRRLADGIQIVISQDMAEDFAKHVKKFGAFSKITLSAPRPIYPAMIDGIPSFDTNDSQADAAWQLASIAQGNYWVTKDNSEKFQPQELRLHQRGGVAYDKGCYLGQEIIARLYFKASPKAYLHRVAHADAAFFDGQAEALGLAIVNVSSTDEGAQALVIARPDAIRAATSHGLVELALPDALQSDVGRASSQP
ncbi:YgfZ/GcvT domain-containing protein [Moraxella porci]|uniref:CAF17-like 4Fe-4S cluster assembly/insertion protein YgfZ n=1 Tax=Moraxella porci TaxID=1288392 RepID=UPI002449B744|nr:folate-binding Fe/S cluster repair protein [Moraxella porci]MDH2274172.1 folate-binding Fe/S cluster repair protein [Moraxella porci]